MSGVKSPAACPCACSVAAVLTGVLGTGTTPSVPPYGHHTYPLTTIHTPSTNPSQSTPTL